MVIHSSPSWYSAGFAVPILGFGAVVVHGSHLLVECPAGFRVVLGFLHQLFGAGLIHLGQHLVAGLVVGILRDRDAGLLRFDQKRVLALFGEPRVVAIHGPVTGLYGELLLLQTAGHVVAVGDAVAVGDDDGGSVVGLGLQ